MLFGYVGFGVVCCDVDCVDVECVCYVQVFDGVDVGQQQCGYLGLFQFWNYGVQVCFVGVCGKFVVD